VTAPTPAIRQALDHARELHDLLRHLDRPGIAQLRQRITPHGWFLIACVYAATTPDPPEAWMLTWLDDLADADPTSPQPQWEDHLAC
jgi:hypothetical protein